MKILRARLEDVTDDNEVICDTIEGEVDIDAVLNALIGSRAETLARAEGLKAYIEQLRESVDRAEKYADRIETLIMEALNAAGIPKWSGLKGGAAIVPGGLSVEVINEALIPVGFWKRPDPVIDKSAIRPLLLAAHEQCQEITGNPALTDDERKSALAEVKGVPGAQLKQGSPTLRITKPAGTRKKKAAKGDEAQSVH